MAEQIPYAIAKGLIEKLASLAFDEIGRIYGVIDDLEKLKETLESITVVLSDAEQRQNRDHTIEHWIKRFKKVLHAADDLIDDLAIKDLRRKVNGHSKFGSKVRGFFSSENPIVFRPKLALKIENIRKNFNDVADDMSKLQLNSSLVVLNQNELAWRETSSSVLKSEMIGRKENMKDIMNLLQQTHTNQNVSLIAIVGMGGLGKTALAQLVYNATMEQGLFQKYMWVCVSEDFEVKSVLKKMLKSLQKNEVGDLELDILQQKLRERLNGQRYMLVLDDVWNEDHLKWNDLRNYLMCEGEDSKILVTTRSTRVSQIMGIKNPYFLNGLTKEQSWTLLKNLTFGEDTSRMSPRLESIGKEIAQKCVGVPLAIRSIGGFLRTINEDDDQWSSILNDDIWRLCEERQSIMPVLKLSYQKLPLGLRQCFAYCYLYPKDWEIPKNELIQFWMAQGYLECSNGTQSIEDMGNQYIRALLMRSFFQDVSMDKFGEIKSFKMHDLMHDLAKSIVGNDCHLDSDGKGITGTPMHVAWHSNTICSLESLDASHLRTIICRDMDAMTNPSLLKSLKYLRILNLSRSSIIQLPESIDKIKHLKCLNLSYCGELVSLPKSISNLVGLQTLELTRCWKLVFPTEIIVKLINLRHLEFVGCNAFREGMPRGLGKLTSLQRLSHFVLGDNEMCKSGKLNELKELNNITGEISIINLGLVKDVASESQETNLLAKEHLKTLFLQWRKENKNSDSLALLDNLCPSQNLKELIVWDYPGLRFSGWLSSLNGVVKIDLWCFSNCQYLPPLERLPCLKELRIASMRALKCIYYEEVSNVFFPSLETLNLYDCLNLKGWQRLGDDNEANNIDSHHSLPPFPRVSSFEINKCSNLIWFPTFSLCNSVKMMMKEYFVDSLSKLQHLRIGDVKRCEMLAKEWMQTLTSLKRLFLKGSSNTPLLLRQLQHLPSELQELEIESVDELVLWEVKHDNSTQCQGPSHVLCSLQKFSIKKGYMEALPEQIWELQSLRHVEIQDCFKLKSLPEGMGCLTNLQTLSIYGCPLLYLPPLERLQCLKELQIASMEELKCIYYEEISDVFFPSLETLHLKKCLNFRGWQRLGGDNDANNIDSHLSLPPSPCLSSLEIYDCPNLICMPTLSLPNSVKFMMKKYSVDSLSVLEHLEIYEIKEVEALAEEWMQNLTSLMCLSLMLPSITPPLLRQLQHLPSELQELNIKYIGDDGLIDLWKGEEDKSTQCSGPPHALRSLQKFSIECCGVNALPEQIVELQSLRHIEITRCLNLVSLPEAMCCLTNLQTLSIHGHQHLLDRCQNEIGEDWPKIAHVPNIFLYEDDFPDGLILSDEDFSN